MPGSRLLYYITDRAAFPGDEAARRRRLLAKIREAVQARVDYIQLREKDLPAGELESLAREAVAVIEQSRVENRELRTALLINSRTDVALVVHADGVHLRSKDISPREVKQIWRSDAGAPARELPLIGVSCHATEEVASAALRGASFAVFAPVFEKRDSLGMQPASLERLREACRVKIPVLALGGVNLANAGSCLEAGAAGIAGIRLFQENNIEEVVERLRT